MKKHILALAVVAAFPVAAVAQNVSIYGAIDRGVQFLDTGAATNSKFNRSYIGGLSTNRVGFQGSEDLGGGLKANFQLQTAMNDSQSVFGGTLEESWVGISGAFGAIRIGTTDVTGAQGFESTINGMGNLANTMTISNNTTASSPEEGADTNNVIRYISPTINGFTLDIGYTHGNATTATTNGAVDELGMFVSYVNGPLTVGYGQHEVNGTTVAKENFKVAGVRYDFGVAAIGFVMQKGDASTTADVDISNSTLAANVPLGNGLTVHAATTQAKVQSTDAKARGYLVALQKDLSKRTSVYGVYTALRNSATAQSTWGGIGSLTTVGNDPSAFSFGVRHSF